MGRSVTRTSGEMWIGASWSRRAAAALVDGALLWVSFRVVTSRTDQ